MKLASPLVISTVVVPVSSKSGSLFAFNESVIVPVLESIVLPRPSVNLIFTLKLCPACTSIKLLFRNNPCELVITISAVPINCPSSKALITARPGVSPALNLTLICPFPMS